MAWEYLPVDIERCNREFVEGVERKMAEIAARLARTERLWKEGEDARRREWEALEGRTMTGWDKIDHFHDGLMRKNTMIAQTLMSMMWNVQEEARIAHEELKEDMRANREATLKMLDRLSEPPFG